MGIPQNVLPVPCTSPMVITCVIYSKRPTLSECCAAVCTKKRSRRSQTPCSAFPQTPLPAVLALRYTLPSPRTTAPHTLRKGSTPSVGVSTSWYDGTPSALRLSKKFWHSATRMAHSASALPAYLLGPAVTPEGSRGLLSRVSSDGRDCRES